MPKFFMNNAEGLQIARSLNHILLIKRSSAEIGVEFDEIAEQMRSLNLKVYISDRDNRNFDLELYFALERKNKNSFIGNKTEANRLRLRIKKLIREKEIVEDKGLAKKGHFSYKEGVIQGTIHRLVKNERIILQLLHAYDLIV